MGSWLPRISPVLGLERGSLGLCYDAWGCLSASLTVLWRTRGAAGHLMLNIKTNLSTQQASKWWKHLTNELMYILGVTAKYPQAKLKNSQVLGSAGVRSNQVMFSVATCYSKYRCSDLGSGELLGHAIDWTIIIIIQCWQQTFHALESTEIFVLYAYELIPYL